MSWEQAVRDVNKLLQSNRVVLETLSNVKLAPALNVDYDAEVGKWNWGKEEPEWERSPEEYRALTAEEVKGVTLKVGKNLQNLDKAMDMELGIARTFDQIVLDGPQNNAEQEILIAAKIYLTPTEIIEAVNDKLPPAAMRNEISNGMERMRHNVLEKEPEKEKAIKEEPVYVDLKDFAVIKGPLLLLKEMADKATLFADTFVAAEKLRGQVSSVPGTDLASLPGGKQSVESISLPPRK